MFRMGASLTYNHVEWSCFVHSFYNGRGISVPVHVRGSVGGEGLVVGVVYLINNVGWPFAKCRFRFY